MYICAENAKEKITMKKSQEPRVYLGLSRVEQLSRAGSRKRVACTVISGLRCLPYWTSCRSNAENQNAYGYGVTTDSKRKCRI